jgi:hypothetical protein
MAVAMMPRDKESWTDDRLDDLNHKVDEGFKEMREEFRAQRAEFKAEMGSMRAEFREEMSGIRSEISATNRLVAQLAWTMCGTMLVGFLGVIATILATT